MAQQGAQVGVTADGAVHLGEVRLAHESAQDPLLLAGHRTEPRRLPAEVGRPAVDEGEGLEHPVVHGPREPVPLGGR